MVESSKNMQAKSIDAYTTEDVLKKLNSFRREEKKSSNSRAMQIDAAIKKIERPILQFKDGKTTIESVRKGFDGLEELAALMGNRNELAIKAISKTYTDFVEDYYNEYTHAASAAKTGKSSRLKARLKKYAVVGAMGLALVGTPIMASGQTVKSATQQSQALNIKYQTNNPQMKALIQEQNVELEQLKQVQQQQINMIQQNIKLIMSEKLPSKTTSALISQQLNMITQLEMNDSNSTQNIIMQQAQQRESLLEQENATAQERNRMEMAQKQQAEQMKIQGKQQVMQSIAGTGIGILQNALWQHFP